MEFSEMKRNTSNWSNFCMLLRRAGLTALAGLSCILSQRLDNRPTLCCVHTQAMYGPGPLPTFRKGR